MKNVLIIDDEVAVTITLSRMVESMGYEAVTAHTLKSGLEKASSMDCDVILLDVNLPDGNGLDVMPDLKAAPSSPEVIILTGAGTAEGAETAIRTGAWDYLEKPIMANAIFLPLKRVFQFRAEKAESRISPLFKRDRIIGSSPEITKCLELAAKAAASDANVFITGETGTGKELFAQAIHENSCRSENAFVVVDCTSLPETLVESILFGHHKGAFTGADKHKQGLILEAHGGTLFLDEVADMPLANQKKFLRVLQERRFRPLGSEKTAESKFRLIAATNKNLENMVGEGTFREDLLFRVKSVEINLPPLRNRYEDIAEITLWAIRKFCNRYNAPTMGFFPEFLEALGKYSWPGNVRELLSAIDAAVTNAMGENTLHPTHLPLDIRAKIAGSSLKKGDTVEPQQVSGPVIDSSAFAGNFFQYRDEAEKRYFNELLSRTQGSISEACTESGLSRAQLYRLLKKHEIRKDVFK